MATLDVDLSNPFRPQRYPVVRAIIEGDQSSPRSLADMVGDQILGQIIRGELPAGTRLKSTELASTLGVSRTPVAKALAKLTADGVLSQPNNHQAIVSGEAANWLVQIHEIRQLLEPEATARAVGRISPDALTDLWTLSHDAKPTRRYDWTAAARFFDFGLHLSIAEFCGNLPMKVAIRKAWSYKQLSYELSPERQPSLLRVEYEQHVAILSALAEQDVERASGEMAKHLQAASRSRSTDRVV